METLLSLPFGPPPDFHSSSVLRTTRDPLNVSLVPWGRNEAFHHISCSNCEALFFQCVIVRHQKYCQNFQVFLPKAL
jgi:hypothetical protein